MSSTVRRLKPSTRSEGAAQGAAPKYAQLADRLRREIGSGVLRGGDRLPTFAEMHRQFGATATTVERVYSILERDGLIERTRGSGVYVRIGSVPLVHSIGFLSGPWVDATAHPYWALLLEGVHEAARAAGFDVVLLDAGAPTIRWEKVDGALLTSPLPCMTGRIPPATAVVTLAQSARGLAGVVADDAGGTQLAVEHLLGLGHRRIAGLWLGGNAGDERAQGYHRGLREGSIEPQATWLPPTLEIAAPLSAFQDKGRAVMREWLGHGFTETGCTAILAHNDDVAIGVIEALLEDGLKVPGDISVVGFDGTEVSRYFRPRLTTLQVPLREIGVRATQLLLRQMAEDQPTSERLVLPVNLLPGESTSEARQR